MTLANRWSRLTIQPEDTQFNDPQDVVTLAFILGPKRFDRLMHQGVDLQPEVTLFGTSTSAYWSLR
jgi:hypothetical protein